MAHTASISRTFLAAPAAGGEGALYRIAVLDNDVVCYRLTNAGPIKP